MKDVTTKVKYRVPNWNYCNHDMLGDFAKITNATCRFCEKSQDGYRCLIYNRRLSAKGKLINKTNECINATY